MIIFFSILHLILFRLNNTKIKYTTVPEYISTFSKETQQILKNIRKVIKDTVPEAEETISYQLPTYKLNGKNLVHFGGFKNHIGFFPTPGGISKFNDELSEYETSKGTIQFPLDKPIPYDLIVKIVKFRVKEVSKV